MKLRALRKRFRGIATYWPWALALFLYLPPVILLVVFLLDGRLIETLTLSGSDARQILHADRWISTNENWTPPASLKSSMDGVLADDLPWTRVDLPETVPQDLGTQPLLSPLPASRTPPRVVWYRVQLTDNANLAEIRHVYLPRIFVSGTAAIYLDGRVVWSQPDSPLLPPYYKPILLSVNEAAGSDPAGRPGAMYIRIAARAKDGSAISTPWVARSRVLERAYELRSIFQYRLVDAVWLAYWGTGTLAFLMFIWRRRKRDRRVYLSFSAFAFLTPIDVANYMISDFIARHQSVIAWIVEAGIFVVALCAVAMYTAMLEIRRVPLLRYVWLFYFGCVVYISYRCAVYATAGLASAGVDEIPQLIMCPMIIQQLYVVYFTYVRRNRLAAMIQIANILFIIAAVHDVYVASHRGRSDDLMYLTVVFASSLPIYIAVIAGKFATSLSLAESSHLVVREALAQKERELNRQHAALLRIHNEQFIAQERERMMQEMHDGIGSSLISAVHYLRNGDKDSIDAARVLEECIDDLKLSIDSLDTTGGDLPQLLSSLRFRLSPRLRGRGVAFAWDVEDLPPLSWLDAQHSMHILRILQEVLTNLLKHSDATAVRVWTAQDAPDGMPGVIVCIADNGKPFVPPAPDQISPGRRGMGNIVSRTRLLGGRCEWRSLDDGNCFVLWLPLASTQDA